MFFVVNKNSLLDQLEQYKAEAERNSTPVDRDEPLPPEMGVSVNLTKMASSVDHTLFPCCSTSPYQDLKIAPESDRG